MNETINHFREKYIKTDYRKHLLEKEIQNLEYILRKPDYYEKVENLLQGKREVFLMGSTYTELKACSFNWASSKCLKSFLITDDYGYLAVALRYKDYLVDFQKNEYLSKEDSGESSKSRMKGFQSKLTLQQIQSLFEKSRKKDYIDKNTRWENFKAVFSNEPLPANFEKVKWILLTPRGTPHKTAFREFIECAIGKAPSQKQVDLCFFDSKGKPIKLAKPKREPNTWRWSDIFREMIS